MIDRTVKALLIAYRETFAAGAGKTVLDDLVRRFADRDSFMAGDSHVTAYREGQRSVVLLIQRHMRALTKPGSDDAAEGDQ